MPYVKGFLEIVSQGQPDQGLPGGGFGGRPDQGLPGGPVDPGFGGGRPGGVDPGYGQGGGFRPSNELPGQGGHPSNELPPIPGVWPPPTPSNPIVPVPPPSGETKPIEPGTIWPPLAPGAEGKYLVVVWVPTVGYRYTVIDTSLSAGMPLPGEGGHPSGQPVPGGERPPHVSGQPVPPTASTPLPPTAAPKSK